MNWSKIYSPNVIFVTAFDKDNKIRNIEIKGFKNVLFIEVAEENHNENGLLQFISYLKRKNIRVVDNKCKVTNKFTLYGHLNIKCFEVYVEGNIYIKDEDKYTETNKIFNHNIINNDIDEVVKYVSYRNINFCDWIEIKNPVEVNSVITCSYDDVYPVDIDHKIRCIQIVPTILYFDIECEELFKNDEDEDEEDEWIDDDEPEVILQISIIVTSIEDTKIYLITLYDVDPKFIIDPFEEDVNTFSVNINHVKIIKCSSTKEVLEKFFNIIKKENPQRIGGYNILEYDWTKILKVCKRVGVNEFLYMSDLSCRIGTRNTIKKSTWESAQQQRKEFQYLKIVGRSNMDAIQHVKKFTKQSSFTLANVSKNVFPSDKIRKMDVDFRVIQKLSKLKRRCDCFIERTNNTAEKDLLKKLLYIVKDYLKMYCFLEIIYNFLIKVLESKSIDEFLKCFIEPFSIIGKYCIVDSLLCVCLTNRYSINENCQQFSNICYLLPEDVLVSGNQKGIINILYEFATKEDIILNKAEKEFDMLNKSISDNLSGAYVLDPVCGLHKGVILLDFNSLYPNIIINYNISYDTLLLEKTETSRTITTKEGGEFYFEHESVRVGLLSKLEKKLINDRKLTRHRIRLLKETDKENPQILSLECKQNALKIIANSVYGATGAKNGKRILMPAAASICTIGRELLAKVRDFAQDDGYTVLYGDTDSIMVSLKSDIMNDSKLFLNDFVNKLIKTYYTNEVISSSGQELIKKIIEELQNKKYLGLYGDSDTFTHDQNSLYINKKTLNSDVTDPNMFIQYLVNTSLKECFPYDTEENIIKLKREIFGFTIDNLYTDNRFKNFTNFKIVFKSEWKDVVKTIIKSYFEDDVFNKIEGSESFLDIDEFIVDNGKECCFSISKLLKRRVDIIGNSLSKKFTSKINELEKTEFYLEFETSFENYLLIGKKNYVGSVYDSNELIKKGVMSVKRIYSTAEKNIYDDVIKQLFGGKNILNNMAESFLSLFNCKKTFVNDFILSMNFKNLKSYAKKSIPGLYIDKDGKRFKIEGDSRENMNRLIFSKIGPHLAVAINCFKRDDPIPNNSRIEYVYFRDSLEGNFMKNKKSNKCDTYEYVYRNKKKIDFLEYLTKLIPPLCRVIETIKIRKAQTLSTIQIHIKLAKIYEEDLPDIDDVITIHQLRMVDKEPKESIAESENEDEPGPSTSKDPPKNLPSKKILLKGIDKTTLLQEKGIKYSNLNDRNTIIKSLKSSGYIVGFKQPVIDKFSLLLLKRYYFNKYNRIVDVEVNNEIFDAKYIKSLFSILNSKRIIKIITPVRNMKRNENIIEDIYKPHEKYRKVIIKINNYFLNNSNMIMDETPVYDDEGHILYNMVLKNLLL